jgi:hypothetical protein
MLTKTTSEFSTATSGIWRRDRITLSFEKAEFHSSGASVERDGRLGGKAHQRDILKVCAIGIAGLVECFELVDQVIHREFLAA